LCASGCLQPGDLPAHWRQSDSSQAPQQLLVTHAITVQAGAAPHFTQPHRTGDVVPQTGTVIGHDGAGPDVTPYDTCVLIMPSLAHAKPGATLVRLARLV
ncbi:MAG: succinylglutamate desuccinylase, partial [Betaproteobacteria bacterium]